MRHLLIILLLSGLVFVGCSNDQQGTDWHLDEDDAGVEDVADDNDADDTNGGSDSDAGDDGDADTPEIQCETSADCTQEAYYCDREPGCDELGTCQEIPSVPCDAVETPYCDCNGEIQISPSSCVWDAVNDPDVCEDEPVECLANDECGDGQYCQREPGCREPGQCRPIEEASEGGCGDALTTYCTCDGRTEVSPNTCIAEPYDHLGACENNGGDIGEGECELNSDCDELSGEYCNRPQGCDERGVCEPIPTDDICLQVLTDYCNCKNQSKTAPTSCIYEPVQHMGHCQM